MKGCFLVEEGELSQSSLFSSPLYLHSHAQPLHCFHRRLDLRDVWYARHESDLPLCELFCPL